jgi:hypothetical protein
MPEGTNIEVAQILTESETAAKKAAHHQFVEILEAIVLALVAIATAWSGLQSSRWDGHQARLYGTSVTLRVEAALAATEGGQQRLMDVATLNSWIEAIHVKNESLSALYVRRFSPEYRSAFEAWLKTRPFETPAAPAGPAFMPGYHNVLLEESARLNGEAAGAFAEGTEARTVAERYVRVTVFLATVLFLIALSQRFRSRSARVGLLAVAAVLLTAALVSLASYPRL